MNTSVTSLIASLVGSVLSYVFYWLAVIAFLVYYKFKEVRTPLLLCVMRPALFAGTHHDFWMGIGKWQTKARMA